MNQRFGRTLRCAALGICILFLCLAQVGAQPQKNEELQGPDPVVDLATPSDHSPSPAIRDKRNRRYKQPEGPPLQEPKPGSEKVLVISDSFEHVTALPVDESDTIVLGQVVSATAFLSEDKRGVYSEFSVKVDQVLKNTTTVPLNVGETMALERPGGVVRFSSGKTWRLRFFQQGFPRVGGDYVFFLRYQPETEDYFLATGYLLRDGKVTPLDGIGFGFDSGTPFHRYVGVDAPTFMVDLRNAMKGGVVR